MLNLSNYGSSSEHLHKLLPSCLQLFTGNTVSDCFVSALSGFGHLILEVGLHISVAVVRFYDGKGYP